MKNWDKLLFDAHATSRKEVIHMPFEITTVALISVMSLLFSIFVWAKSNKRTDTKDVEERVKENTKINMKLDTIGTNVSDIKAEVGSLNATVHKQEEKLILVEASTKSAHHRIDSLEERLNLQGRTPRGGE